MVGNEVIDSANKEKRGCLLFKVEFEKAYDKVNWSFLKYMMHRMSFGENGLNGWRLWCV